MSKKFCKREQKESIDTNTEMSHVWGKLSDKDSKVAITKMLWQAIVNLLEIMKKSQQEKEMNQVKILETKNTIKKKWKM